MKKTIHLHNDIEKFILWNNFGIKKPNQWWFCLHGGLPINQLIPLSDFRWWRAKKWVWIEGKEFVETNYSDNKPVLEFGDKIEVLVPIFSDEGCEVYYPHRENPALFLEIQNLENTKESLKEFVSNWGPLTPNSVIVEPLNKDLIKEVGIKTVRQDGVDLLSGISFQRYQKILSAPSNSQLEEIPWLENLRKLSGLIDLYLAWKNKNFTFLKDFFEQKKRDIKKSNILDKAKDYFLGPLNSLLVSKLDISPLIDGSKGQYHISIQPFTLEAFIVLQFAQAITERKNFIPCQMCGKPMEVTPDKRSQKKKFCDSNCSMKAYRKRKKDKKS